MKKKSISDFLPVIMKPSLLTSTLFFLILSTSALAQTIFAVNTGGPRFVDIAGVVYQADNTARNFEGGNAYNIFPVAGTEDDFIYLSERFGDFSYSIPVSKGECRVTLQFAEIYWSDVQKRLFDVTIEDKKIISRLDLYAKTGKLKAYDVTTDVPVEGETLDIQFNTVRNNAKLSAIVVRDSSGKTTAINAGGPAYIDGGGNHYFPDMYYSGGESHFLTKQIHNTWDDFPYLSERYGDFSYNIPVDNGYYVVVLQFAEIFWQSESKRIFDVKIEDKEALTNLDVFKFAGGNFRAYSFGVPVRVNDSNLNIDFHTDKDDAKVSAISVQKLKIKQSETIDKVMIAINAGGVLYVDSSGIVYQADQNFSGGSTIITDNTIAGTSDAPLFQSARFGTFSYDFPLPAGNYTVIFKGAEFYWDKAGQSVFNVIMEDEIIAENTDLIELLGRNRAGAAQFPVHIDDGLLSIRFETVNNNASVCAFIVMKND